MPVTHSRYWWHGCRGQSFPLAVASLRLRKKLSEATDGDNYIETVWGRGYVLRDPERLEEQEAIAASA